MVQIRYGRKRHIHEEKKLIPIPNQGGIVDSWIEECSCGMRRIGRIGWGRESGTYYSRWYDSSEIDKLKRLFPEIFARIVNQK
jgi:hypothetical protein